MRPPPRPTKASIRATESESCGTPFGPRINTSNGDRSLGISRALTRVTRKPRDDNGKTNPALISPLASMRKATSHSSGTVFASQSIDSPDKRSHSSGVLFSLQSLELPTAISSKSGTPLPLQSFWHSSGTPSPDGGNTSIETSLAISQSSGAPFWLQSSCRHAGPSTFRRKSISVSAAVPLTRM